MSVPTSKQLRIGFVIPRTPFLKDFGPLIAHILKNGHHAVLFYSPNAARGTKAYQRITRRDLETFASPRTELVEFELPNLVEKCRKALPDMLVTLDGEVGVKDRFDLFSEIRTLGIKVVSLASFFETALRPLELFEHFDKVYYMSEFGLNLHFATQLGHENQSRLRQAFATKYEITSSPVFDQLRFGDYSAVRERYNIPNGKKVVLLVAPVLTPDTPWRFGVWRMPGKLRRTLLALRRRNWGHLWDIWTGPTFPDFVKSVRRFCERNDALLVVKSRAKHQDPDYLIEAADVYLEGSLDEYFPLFTTYQLLALADLCITAMSMSVAEAVVAGVPVFNVSLPFMDKAQFAHHRLDELNRYYTTTFDQAHPSPTNYPGAVNSVNWRQAPAWLAGKSFADISYDEAVCIEYMQRYLGITEQSSSQLLLGSFLRLCGYPEATQSVGVENERLLQ